MTTIAEAKQLAAHARVCHQQAMTRVANRRMNGHLFGRMYFLDQAAFWRRILAKRLAEIRALEAEGAR
jgi:protocatechuate 3,4-dioxygenase beta subunit